MPEQRVIQTPDGKYHVVNITESAEPPPKVQAIRGPDGMVHVSGLQDGQQLIRMPDGKYRVLSQRR